MGCKRRIKKIAATTARHLQPHGMRLIADIVGIVAKTDWSSSEKREIAVQMAEAALRKRGEEAKQHLIRLAVEASVAALKDSEEALADIGTAEEADIQAAEAEAEE